MNILIAGGSGFIGSSLARFLQEQGHQVVVLTRSEKIVSNATVRQQHWDAQQLTYDQPVDVIINLCGFNIAAKRWSSQVKQTLKQSRLQPTMAIVDYIRQLPTDSKPLLINASAIGFYPSTKQKQTEKHYVQTKKDLFSKALTIEWEKAAQLAHQAGASVVCARFGVVIGRQGGMLKKLLPSYKLGLGSIISDGNMYLSWVTLSDLCRALYFIMSIEKPKSVYNITTPYPCTQKQFATKLAKKLRRPCCLHLPAWFIKLTFGQMGEELLLADQFIYPQHLIDAGFNFNYADIGTAIDIEIT